MRCAAITVCRIVDGDVDGGVSNLVVPDAGPMMALVPVPIPVEDPDDRHTRPT